MSRISETLETNLVLDVPEALIDCPATFGIEGEEYPAEPTSWGDSRGHEISVSAELVKFGLGDAVFPREVAVAVIGEAALEAQETSIAEDYALEYTP